jgi:CheY-like chemotaxis protein
MAEPPLVLMLVSDLFFAVQIEAAVKALGYRLARVERGDDVEPGVTDRAPSAGGKAFLGEPLTGRGAGFVSRLVEWQPALVIVELSSQSIPWAEWIAAMKSSPATRRIPVVAFGPHTDLDLRAAAVDAGCDAVVAKSRLVTALPDLILKYAREVDQAALQAECEGEVSALARKGIELFNQQAYFEAHEELELAWNEEPGPVRELYRGILQVAVAYLQITRRNYRGALKMFLRVRQWLDPIPDGCRGVAVARLRAEALAARAELEAVGPDGMADFDLSLLKPVQLAAPRVRPSNGHKST